MRAEVRQEFGVDPEPLRLPRGVRVSLRGEVASMRESFSEMGFNLVLAVLLWFLNREKGNLRLRPPEVPALPHRR